jgi:hypothetical protein
MSEALRAADKNVKGNFKKMIWIMILDQDHFFKKYDFDLILDGFLDKDLELI